MTARCGAKLPIDYGTLICGLPAGHDGFHQCTRGSGSLTSWAPSVRNDVDSAAAELFALQHIDHPLPGWDVTCSACRLTPAEAFRLGYRAALDSDR